MNIKQELKEIVTEQKRISRNVQFLINGGIIFTSLYKVKEYENSVVKGLSLATAGLAMFSQILLMVEDLKETINEPDDEDLGDVEEE